MQFPSREFKSQLALHGIKQTDVAKQIGSSRYIVCGVINNTMQSEWVWDRLMSIYHAMAAKKFTRLEDY